MGLISAAGCVLIVVFVGLLRGIAPVQLGMLALELGVFAVTLTGIHQLIEFTVTQWETQKTSERLATERERRRLSQDLHDLVGRDLVALVMRAEVVARSEPGRHVEEELRHIAALARTTLNNTLAVVEEMRAPDVAAELDDARELLIWAGIDLAVFGVPAEVHRRAAFAWFLREAVTNVVKHSGAQTCRVIFGPDRLTVEDDGRPGWAVVPGAGLTGLRERLEQVGGELLIGRSQDGGVRVVARLVKGR
ncbi:sensor histidine kinase [Streptosporangium sp. NPDC000396]|uniref:sensor histidine kinase n=1 Tax=Streptosporangium sp. NPDC000396 TaxID=3366185 RepID=UPI0036CBE298